MDEETEEGEPDESGENLGEEDPSREMRLKAMIERKMTMPIRAVMMTTTTLKGRGHLGTKTRKQTRPRSTKNHLVDPMKMAVVEMQEKVQTLRWIARSKYEGQKGGAVVGSQF